MLAIDLRGKRAFIAGIGDDQGYGWAIAKALAECGAQILVGTWTPMMKIFTTAYEKGKFDESRKLSDGTLLQIEKVYPLDASFDTLDDVPLEIRENKRYKEYSKYTVAEVAEEVEKDYGTIDILVHSLANGPEVSKPLSETTRSGYLAALSASTYSFISLLKYFEPLMPPGSATLSLSYMAAEKAVPGYGGGMSSAKAALESDTKTLSWEMGRKNGIRVNTISAGPWRSRAAKAIGFIDTMIDYLEANAPLEKALDASEIAATAAFLVSPLASGITGTVLHVDNGLHAMGVAMQGIMPASRETCCRE